jgi:hypothetical protein
MRMFRGGVGKTDVALAKKEPVNGTHGAAHALFSNPELNKSAVP